MVTRSAMSEPCPSGMGAIGPGCSTVPSGRNRIWRHGCRNEVLGDRLQRLRAGSVEVLVQIPAVGLAGRVVRSDHPDPSLGLHGVVADDGSEALFALVGLQTSLTKPPGRIRLPWLAAADPEGPDWSCPEGPSPPPASKWPSCGRSPCCSSTSRGARPDDRERRATRDESPACPAFHR